MDPRARWQALQAHLSAARFAVKMGDREKAREEVETALSIDPDFLAARLLRDQLNTPDTPAVPPPASVPPPQPSAVAAPSASLASSAATLAQFEERVKQRVREREAAPPPALEPSTRRRRASWTVRAGAVAAAGVAFAVAVAVSSNSRVSEPQLLSSHATTLTASLVDSVIPNPLNLAAPPAPIVDDEPVVAERPFMRPPPPSLEPTRIAVTAPVTQPPASMPVIATPLPVQAAPVSAVVTDSPPPAFVPRVVNERALVEETLNKYRWAYNRLDAQSAQEVYPAVNANALAHAFDGLQSQSLQFDECEIDVRGGAASATCRGTSRYVPKIGNRDPHVEPRIWDFTLKKDGADWQIESARAAR